jgi:hypothetical protein
VRLLLYVGSICQPSPTAESSGTYVLDSAGGVESEVLLVSTLLWRAGVIVDIPC